MSKKGGAKDGTNRKLAILLITTHGNLDSTVSLGSDGKTVEGENMITDDGKINVHKIDATRRGVCNYISDTYMDEMIQQMTRFINFIYQEELKEDCPDNKKDALLCFNGSDNQNKQKIVYLSETLRSFMIKIDEVRKETKSTSKIHAKKGAFPEKDHLMFEPSDWKDKDLSDYFKNVDDTYTLTQWKNGDQYEDKLYTLDPKEKVSEDASAANNTMILLTPGGYEYLLPEFNKTFTRSYISSDDYTIRLSQVIESLKNQEYTDAIIIDLSCNVGSTDRITSNLLRGPRRRGGKKMKGNRKTSYKKKRGQKRRTKNKRTRKHRN